MPADWRIRKSEKKTTYIDPWGMTFKTPKDVTTFLGWTTTGVKTSGACSKAAADGTARRIADICDIASSPQQAAEARGLPTGWSVSVSRKTRGSADVRFRSPTKAVIRSVKALIELLGEAPMGITSHDGVNWAVLQVPQPTCGRAFCLKEFLRMRPPRRSRSGSFGWGSQMRILIGLMISDAATRATYYGAVDVSTRSCARASGPARASLNTWTDASWRMPLCSRHTSMRNRMRTSSVAHISVGGSALRSLAHIGNPTVVPRQTHGSHTQG